MSILNCHHIHMMVDYKPLLYPVTSQVMMAVGLWWRFVTALKTSAIIYIRWQFCLWCRLQTDIISMPSYIYKWQLVTLVVGNRHQNCAIIHMRWRFVTMTVGNRHQTPGIIHIWWRFVRMAVCNQHVCVINNSSELTLNLVWAVLLR